MGNHRGFWYSGYREPKLPRTFLLPETKERDRRGQQSRQQHNELREYQSKKPKGSPAERMERKRIFGYWSDKTGRTYTKAQIDSYVRSKQKGEIPQVPLDEKSLVYHPPESKKDLIDSIGEIYVPKGQRYPVLRIGEGIVLIDPKLRHVDPALK